MPRPTSSQRSRRAAEPPPSDPSLRAPRHSQSLIRGLAILACFTGDRPVMGIADIADGLGMSRSTTHRYVITLAQLGYLEQGASQKYRLGLRATDLGLAALNATGLREQAHPQLEDLRQQTSLTASLGVLDGTDLLYVDRVRSFRSWPGQTEHDLHTGSRAPAYATSMGKLLLAHLPDAQRRDLIAQLKLLKRGPNTITTKNALEKQLDEIRETGLAISDQELAPNLLSIAAPVRNAQGEVVAAIDLAAHSSIVSLDELVETRGPQLIAAAARISTSLAGAGLTAASPADVVDGDSRQRAAR
jgi:IclR family pca regulon transcriptional regulator